MKDRALKLYTNNKNLDKKVTTTFTEKWDTPISNGGYVTNLNTVN